VYKIAVGIKQRFNCAIDIIVIGNPLIRGPGVPDIGVGNFFSGEMEIFGLSPENQLSAARSAANFSLIYDTRNGATGTWSTGFFVSDVSD